MKKFYLVAALLILTGCTRIQTDTVKQSQEEKESSSQKDVTMTCSKGENSTSFRATGDEITSTIETFSISLEDAGVDKDMDLEKTLEKINEGLQEKYGDLKGVDVKAVIDNDQIQYTYTINYLTADFDALLEAGILQEGEMENQYISLEKTKNEFESSGFACTIQ